MTLMLNINAEQLTEALEDIIEVCAGTGSDEEKISEVCRIATKAIVLQEREGYLFSEGNC
jgi:hypothetical protein